MLDVWIDVPIERTIMIGTTSAANIKTWKRLNPGQSWCQYYIGGVDLDLIWGDLDKNRRRVLALTLMDSDVRETYISEMVNADCGIDVFILHGDNLIEQEPRWRRISVPQKKEVEFQQDDLAISNVLSLFDEAGFKPYKKHHPRVFQP